MTSGRLNGQEGYTFPLMLLILLALAVSASRIELTSSYRLKREREMELLFRGRAYMRAIQAYYNADPVFQRRHYPKSLEDLISDSRFGGRRYIRQLYKDPMTGEDFRPILAVDKTIVGVASQSSGVPLKTTDFPRELPDFDKAKTYADWEFHTKNLPVLLGRPTGPTSAAPRTSPY